MQANESAIKGQRRHTVHMDLMSVLFLECMLFPSQSNVDKLTGENMKKREASERKRKSLAPLSLSLSHESFPFLSSLSLRSLLLLQWHNTYFSRALKMARTYSLKARNSTLCSKNGRHFAVNRVEDLCPKQQRDSCSKETPPEAEEEDRAEQSTV